MSHEVYTLQGGEKGKHRLNILNSLYNHSTQQFLIQSGLCKGMMVLEVGCGTGEMACWIAQQVGPEGKVIAVDSDIKQVELAQQHAKLLGIANIVFLQRSIYELDDALGKFDITFTRWVIGHLINPKRGLVALFDRLKPNGKMINISPHLDSIFAYPESDALTGWYQLWTSILKEHGKDIRLGYRLPELMKEVGCRALSIKLFQPILSTPEDKLLFYLNIKECTAFALGKGIINPNNLYLLLEDLRSFAYLDNFVAYMRNIEVCGVKDILQLRNEVIYQILVVLSAHFKRDCQNLFTLLDKLTLLNIFDNVQLPSVTNIRTSARDCAEFVYDNYDQIRVHLANKKSIKMIEEKQETGLSRSRFLFFYDYSTEQTISKMSKVVVHASGNFHSRL